MTTESIPQARDVDDLCLDCGKHHALPRGPRRDEHGIQNFRIDGIPDCRVIAYAQWRNPRVSVPLSDIAIQAGYHALPYTTNGCRRALELHNEERCDKPVDPQVAAGAVSVPIPDWHQLNAWLQQHDPATYKKFEHLTTTTWLEAALNIWRQAGRPDLTTAIETAGAPRTSIIFGEIRDQAQGHSGTRKIKVTLNESTLEIFVEGYGNDTMEPDSSSLVALELYEGQLRLLAFDDIHDEAPKIHSLEGASEALRT